MACEKGLYRIALTQDADTLSCLSSYTVIPVKTGIQDSIVKKAPTLQILAHKHNEALSPDMPEGLNRYTGKQLFARRCGMILRSGTKIWIPAFAGMTMEG
jgi:hypothetical protein